MIQELEEYLVNLAPDRLEVILKLIEICKTELPKGFEAGIQYKMPTFFVPHSLYPKGYHCDPKIPLPFISIASQKNFIALYHMGLYADTALTTWFVEEYPKYSKAKLDMGKSCIRFKKMEDIPYDLIKELATKMTLNQWVNLYEKNIKQK